MRGVRIAACAAAAAIGVGVAGCGGGDSSSTSTAASITKEEFVTQANQICADGNETIDAAVGDAFSGGQPSQEETEQFVTGSVIPAIQAQVDGLRALGAPEGDEEQVDAILDAADQGIEEAQADPASFIAGGGDPFVEANQLAADYGLTECAG